ncbi:oxygenase MpaB family protein [Nonomuraea sp. NPDC049480]|uniref:oxygenase MpaB family protein n=1 Tax=Nonomuraea sp. NPDC049480 TaxID=3364353 RepID=UPI003796C8EE
MAELSRREALISGTALGALGALGMVSPAQADSLSGDWTWPASGSIAGSGSGADPRWVWDDVADPLLASLLDRGAIPEVNRLLYDWNRNDQPLPAGLPEDLRAFIEQARQLPSWADPTMLDAGARFHALKGNYIVVLTIVGAGMLATAIPKEARAVYYSAGGADLKDRIAKTNILAYAVRPQNAWGAGGTAVVEAVKTRLVHAAVRHLLKSSPHWSGPIPISQEDMLVTWHTLATYSMRGMREWKVRISPTEAAGYLHSVQMLGHMLGIRDEFLPATWDSSYAQSDLVLPRNMGPTREGVELNAILRDMLAELTSPGGIDKPLVNAFSRYLTGNQVADWNGIRREPLWDPVVKTAWPLLVQFREGLIGLPLVPAAAWLLDEMVKKWTTYYLTKGAQTKIVIPTGNRPS